MRKLIFTYGFLLIALTQAGRVISSSPATPVAAETSRQTAFAPILMHTDRDIYVAGERMLCSVYLLADKAPDDMSKFAYLALRGKYGTVTTGCVSLHDSFFHGAFPIPDTLSSGLYELIGFTNWMRNYGDAVYFRKTLVVANRFDEKLDAFDTLTADPDEIKTIYRGEAVEILLSGDQKRRSIHDIQLVTSIDEDTSAFFSVHIAPVQSILPGLEAWRQSITEAHLHDTAVKENDHISGQHTHLMEHTFRAVSGQVISSLTGLPVDKARVILNTAGPEVNFRYEETDPYGYFSFLLDDPYHEKKLVFTVDPATVSDQVAIVLDEKYDFSYTFQPPPPVLEQHALDFIRESQEIVKLQKLFGTDHIVEYPRVPSNTTLSRLYSKPVHHIRPSEFVPLHDLREISRELAPIWRIRPAGTGYTHMLIDETSRTQLPGEPVMFLNGIVYFDINPLIDLGSNHIDEIQFVNLNWVYGEMLFPGIVSIISHHEEAASVPLTGTRAVLQLDAVIPSSRYEVPSYDDRVVNMSESPDLRQVLLWEPLIRHAGGSPAQLRWYSGDLPGSYAIIARSFGKDGKEITAIKEFVIE